MTYYDYDTKRNMLQLLQYLTSLTGIPVDVPISTHEKREENHDLDSLENSTGSRLCYVKSRCLTR